MAYIGNTPVTQSFIAGTDYFSGTGTQTVFTLSRSVNSTNDILVVVNSVAQTPITDLTNSYTVSGNTLTFSIAPTVGTNNVYVRYMSTTLQSVVPSPGSVGIAQLSATGNPTASTFLAGNNTWAPALSGVVTIAQGGTGQTTQQTAINALVGSQTNRSFLRSDGSNATMGAIQVLDVPILNQNTTGTATNVTGTVGIGNGGTGQTTQQAALNALAGAQTAGRYLRSDGTNTSLAAIVAGDVPILNQNTTGTASNVTGIVAIVNGGTGNTTGIAVNISGLLAVINGGTGLTSPGTSGNVLTSNGTAWVSQAAGGGASGIAGQTFTSSGTFTVPAGVTTIKVTGAGGGAGGGGGADPYQGGNGGSAGVGFGWLAVTPGASISVTIGNAGTGGTAGGSDNATDGTDTTFSTMTFGRGFRGRTGSGGSPGANGANGSVTGATQLNYGYFASRGNGGGGGAGGSPSYNGGNGTPGIVVIEW